MKRPAFLLACILSLAAGASAKPVALQVEATGAPQLMLRGKDARQQLLVTAKLHDGALSDFTHKAHYAASPAGIVKVDSDGVVTPLADGTATVTANFEGVSASLPVNIGVMRFRLRTKR